MWTISFDLVIYLFGHIIFFIFFCPKFSSTSKSPWCHSPKQLTHLFVSCQLHLEWQKAQSYLTWAHSSSIIYDTLPTFCSFLRFSAPVRSGIWLSSKGRSIFCNKNREILMTIPRQRMHSIFISTFHTSQTIKCSTVKTSDLRFWILLTAVKTTFPVPQLCFKLTMSQQLYFVEICF